MKRIISTIGICLLTSHIYTQGGVRISDTGGAPDVSAMLEVSSTSKGLLIPRIALIGSTDATTIVNGNVTSLLIYNTATITDVTPGYYYWDGSIWRTLGDDNDADPTNEIELPSGGNNGQLLSTDGSGTYTWVSAGASSDNQDIQNLAFDNSTNILTVGIQNGTSQTVDLSILLNDADSNPTNEIELPSGGINGQLLSTNGAGVYSWVNTIPTGAVIAFNANTCPTGWIKANGQSGTPDLRGEFVRGLDDGRGVDAGRNLASTQTESYRAHNHSVDPPATSTTSGGNHSHVVNPPSTSTNTTGNHNHSHNDYCPEVPASGTYDIAVGANQTQRNDRTRTTSTAGNHSHTVNIPAFNSLSAGSHTHTINIAQFASGTSGSTETRPRNVALLYCIKQ